MISFQPQPFSGAGGWPVCPWGWAMPAGSLGTSNQHLHKLNQVKVNHSSTMAASPAVALPWAHLSPGSPSSSHRSLPHTQTGHWSWLFPHLSRNLRMGRRHWGHTSHWSSSPWIFLLCVGHSAWLLSLKATPTPPTVKFFTNCTPSAWHGDAAGVWLDLAQGQRWSWCMPAVEYYGLFWTQHALMVYHQFFRISNAQAEKQSGSAKTPEERV